VDIECNFSVISCFRPWKRSDKRNYGGSIYQTYAVYYGGKRDYFNQFFFRKFANCKPCEDDRNENHKANHKEHHQSIIL